jgi:hypothetical protein
VTLKRDVRFASGSWIGWQSTVCAPITPLVSTLIHLVRGGREAANLPKLLPKEILSELCIVMASPPANPTPRQAEVRRSKKRERNRSLDDDAYEHGTSEKEERAPKRRSCVGAVNRDLDFCRGLIDRILSPGPGFWARFVKPFKEPVDPDLEGIPDYFEVITCPMDLSTIKTKMDRNEYADAKEFEADIRQMFQNCYTYWNETDVMFTFCKEFERPLIKGGMTLMELVEASEAGIGRTVRDQDVVGDLFVADSVGYHVVFSSCFER